MPRVDHRDWLAEIIEREATAELAKQEAGTARGAPLEMDEFLRAMARRAAIAVQQAATEQMRAHGQQGAAVEVVIAVPVGIVQTLCVELLGTVRRRGAELGLGEPVIGAAIAATLVYYARECGLSDPMIAAVLASAMAETPRGERIGPLELEFGGTTPRGKA